MNWVTRTRPGVDQLASAWLIWTFIDPPAEIRCLPTSAIPAAAPATSFGAPSATYRPRPPGDRAAQSAFEALLEAYALDDDPALVELARIVHAASCATGADRHPFGPVLRAIGSAMSTVEHNDDQLLVRSRFTFDALYVYCLRATAPTGRPPD